MGGDVPRLLSELDWLYVDGEYDFREMKENNLHLRISVSCPPELSNSQPFQQEVQKAHGRVRQRLSLQFALKNVERMLEEFTNVHIAILAVVEKESLDVSNNNGQVLLIQRQREHPRSIAHIVQQETEFLFHIIVPLADTERLPIACHTTPEVLPARLTSVKELVLQKDFEPAFERVRVLGDNTEEKIAQLISRNWLLLPELFSTKGASRVVAQPANDTILAEQVIAGGSY